MCDNCKCLDRIDIIEEEIKKVIEDRKHSVHQAYSCLHSVGIEHGLRRAIELLRGEND